MIRPAEAADAADVQAIYAHHVLHGYGTFEEVPPMVETIAARMSDVAARGLPWLVAEDEGAIVGYAYAAPFRLRAAYRYTVEDSIYLAPEAMGRGLGKRLLGELISICERMGVREIMAAIGDSENTGSIGVHRALGFRHIGTAERLGYKHGRFLDVIFMQLSLNQDGPPVWEGLSL